MKIGIVTSRSARRIIENVIKLIDEDIRKIHEFRIIALPVPAIGHLDTLTLARLLSKKKKELTGLDILLIPGLCPGSTKIIEKEVGIETYKASRDPGLLPAAIEFFLNHNFLSKNYPLEDYYVDYEIALKDSPIAFRIRDVDIPYRPPPVKILAEIPPCTKRERAERILNRYLEEGAHIIVLGTSFIASVKTFKDRLNLVKDIDKPVICECPNRKILRKALEEECDGVSIAADQVLNAEKEIIRKLAERVVIVGERDTAKLKHAVKILEEYGAKRIIVDPVVGLPLIDYTESVERYINARQLGYPMLFSAANVVEELSADTQGQHALLMSMAVELRASLYLVVEGSYKSIHSVAEAKEAARIIYKSHIMGRTPRDKLSSLLIIKQEIPPPPPILDYKNAEKVPELVEPNMDKGFFLINVDHDRGYIMVEYREGAIRKKWYGRRALGLMRMITRTVELSKEHAGYLGYELAKAEISLETGRTYIQDSPLFRYPWRVKKD